MSLYKKFNSILPINESKSNDRYTNTVFLQNVLSDIEIKKVNEFWSEEASHQAKVHIDSGKEVKKPEIRNARKQYIEAGDAEWLYDKIASFTLLTNAAYFRFDITGFLHPISVNQYTSSCFFDWHMDYGKDVLSNRKLVVCIQLTDGNEYEGGDLQLVNDKITVSKAVGSAAIFPSFLLHRVSPVISGNRKSLVAHIGGPPFR